MSKFLENLSGKSAVTVGFELEFLVAWKGESLARRNFVTFTLRSDVHMDAYKILIHNPYSG